MRPDLRAASWSSLAVELFCYAVIAGGFLGLYLLRFHEPASVVPHHLAIVGALLLIPVSLRGLAWRLGDGVLVRLLVALLMVVPAAMLLAWYALVLVGLDAWGRVTTWPLIRTYVLQAPDLLGVLGIGHWIPLATGLASLLALVVLAWHWLVPRDWVARLARRGSVSGGVAIAVALLLLAVLLLHVLLQRGMGHPREPLALSFLPGAGGLQGHIVGGSPALDADEDAARRAYVPAAAPPGRNLVLIVGDALRAGHMSAYGYARVTTPRLDALVRERKGAIVPNMRAACAESSCGLMALATSRPIAEIGSAPMTLQEVLKRHGYEVHFILGGDHTNFYGLREMYGAVDSYHDGSQQDRYYINDDQLVLERAAGLPPARPGEPVAFQFHLMSSHGLGKRDPALSRYQPAANYYSWRGGSPKRPPSPAAAEAAVNYYDNGMLGFDQTVSELLDQLGRKGYLDNALVVITGDHGEMLGEQGMFSHQYGLSEAVLDIPFILLPYGYAATPVAPQRWVGQIDVAPTILEELGLPAPASWHGRRLQQPGGARDLEIQQEHMFGLYHIPDEGRVLKYVRDLGADTEVVTEPLVDAKGEHDVKDQVPAALLERWRRRSVAGMLNTARHE